MHSYSNIQSLRHGQTNGSAVKKGVNAQQPKIVRAENYRIPVEIERLANLVMKVVHLKLILIIKEGSDTPSYNTIKRIGGLQLGVLSPVCI